MFFQSEPSYVPLKINENEKSSDGDSDDTSVKSVRFSKLTEVRQMSDKEAMEAMLSRLSFTASLRAEQIAQLTANKLQVREVMKISLIFSLLFFFANYTYQIALSNTQAGVVNVIASTSGLFTLIFAAMFPSSPVDKFSSTKLFAVFIMISGVAIISIEDLKVEQKSFPSGVVWSIFGAITYACYIVFLKLQVPNEEKMDFTMFFGFVGLFNMIIMWPGFPLLHLLGWETLQLPNNQQLLYMIINGVVGTVLSELLWLWGCFLTSSLMATLSLSLTIPLTMIFDVWFKGVNYPWLIYIGIIPMMISFIFASILTHNDNCNPIRNCLHWNCFRCCKTKHMYHQVDTDSTEHESLIVDDTDVDQTLGVEEGENDELYSNEDENSSLNNSFNYS